MWKFPIFIILASLHTVSPLSTPQPVRTIAVCGGGITGLSCAKSLSKHTDAKIIVFDPTLPPSTSIVGGGIQLNGGASILRSILDENEFTSFKHKMNPMKEIVSRSFVKDEAELLRIDVDSTLKSFASAKDLVRPDGGTDSFTVMRCTLLEALYDSVKKCSNVEVVTEGVIGVEEVKEGEAHKFNVLTTASPPQPFDLVVGCDGVSSKVKSFVSPNTKAIYSNIRISWAVSAPSMENNETRLEQFFGDGGYALKGTYGYGSGGEKCKMAVLVYREGRRVGKRGEEGVEDENSSWNASPSSSSPSSSFSSRLTSFGLPSEPFSNVATPDATYFDLGVYFHNPFQAWVKGHSGSNNTAVVLCGDAAHAMPPFLGQGANQGIRDADVLARTVARYNKEVEAGNSELNGSLLERLEGYRSKRWAQTTQITLKSVFLGYLEVGGGPLSDFRDNFFSFAGKVGLAKYIWVDGATPKPRVGEAGATKGFNLIESLEKGKLFLEALTDPAKYMDDE